MFIKTKKISHARKEYRCELCCEPILVGMPYIRQFVTDGGDVWTNKVHCECQELLSMDGFNEDVYGEGTDPAIFEELVLDYAREYKLSSGKMSYEVVKSVLKHIRSKKG